MNPLLRRPSHGMTMLQPATRWMDALPTGNGTLGALVHGHIRHEQIIVNHEHLFLRHPRPELPDVSRHLTQLRRLLAQGQWDEAGKFFDQRLKEAGYVNKIDPYHPAFDILVDTPTHAAFADYRRSVDFLTGEASVAWREEGVALRRDLFVSRADNVIVLHLTASARKQVSATLQLRGHDLKAGMGLYRRPEEVVIDFAPGASEGELTLTARYPDGIEFGGVARLVHRGGAARVEGSRIELEAVNEAMLIVAVFANEPARPAIERERRRLASLPADYRKLLARHVKLHRPLFERMTLDLAGGEDRQLDNQRLLDLAYQGRLSPALVERLFELGRFLLICSSPTERPGWPANLQGVWNGDYQPAWESDYHNNVNIQMNYWQALPGNLAELNRPLFDYYRSWLDDSRLNARRVYGCRGIVVTHAQTTHGLVCSGPWMNWTGGAGWLSQHFYDHYLFTGDRQFLAQVAQPFMKEAAEFLDDFLVPGPDGRLMFSPSISPENHPAVPGAGVVTVNATMDVAIARELLTNLCAASRELGVDRDGIARWESLLARLPEYRANADGALREWLDDRLPDNYHHRHLSHLYGLFPGMEITAEGDTALFEAAKTAVEKRLVVGLNSQSGWSLMFMAGIYARLGEGERGRECLELLTRSCVGPNLFTYHNDWRAQGLTLYWGAGRAVPFQIDANMGFSAAVLEMLAFSKPGLVRLLPAMPRDWARGEARGLRCRGGLTLDVRWDRKARRVEATLKADRAQELTVKFPAPVRTLKAGAKVEVRPSGLGKSYRVVALPRGRAVKLTATW